MTLVLEGWLEKKGSFVKSWKRRWFVLTEDKLQYFVDQSQSVLKGGVEILASSEVLSRDGSTHEFKFGVQTGTRILEISADCEETRLMWMDTLHKTINSRRCDHSAGAVNSAVGIKNLFVKKVTKMEADTPMNRALKSQAANAATRKQQRQDACKKSGDSQNADTSLNSKTGGDAPPVTAARSKKKMAHRTARRPNGAGVGRKSSDGRGSESDLQDGADEAGDQDQEQEQEQDQEQEDSEGEECGFNEGVPEPPPVLPAGWEQVATEDGQVYYYHKVTRVSRWDVPSEDVAEALNQRLDESQKLTEAAIQVGIKLPQCGASLECDDVDLPLRCATW
jgi:hypothetical protein